MATLEKIDKALSCKVGEFKPFTACVDAITIKVAMNPNQKKGCQCLTYISRPLDLAIQIAVAPIFAIYQTLKTIYNLFKASGFCAGSLAAVFSPLIFCVKLIQNLWSTEFIITPFNVIIPIPTFIDAYEPGRYERRAILFYENFGIGACLMQAPEVRIAYQALRVERRAAAVHQNAQVNPNNGLEELQRFFSLVAGDDYLEVAEVNDSENEFAPLINQV